MVGGRGVGGLGGRCLCVCLALLHQPLQRAAHGLRNVRQLIPRTGRHARKRARARAWAARQAAASVLRATRGSDLCGRAVGNMPFVPEECLGCSVALKGVRVRLYLGAIADLVVANSVVPFLPLHPRSNISCVQKAVCDSTEERAADRRIRQRKLVPHPHFGRRRPLVLPSVLTCRDGI